MRRVKVAVEAIMERDAKRRLKRAFVNATAVTAFDERISARDIRGAVTRRWLVLAITLAPHLAAANAAAPPPAPKLSAVAVAGDKTPLAVDRASLRIDCRSRSECALEVHYTISNPTDAALGGTAAFYGMSTSDMNVRVDGQAANATIDETSGAAFDRSVEQVAKFSGLGSNVPRQGFAVSVAPHASVQVVITGTLSANIRRGYDGFAPPPDRARHLALTPQPPRSARMQLDYLVAPIRTWGVAPKAMAFTFVHPASWKPYVSGAEDLQTTTAPDGRTVREGRVPTTIDTLVIDVYLGETSSWLRGGVFVGIGGNVDDATGTRLRAGGELAIKRHFLASLAFETESGSPTSYLVIPAIHAATPWILIIPSLGAGVGVPLRVSPSFEVGVRFQLDAQFGPIGYFVAFDTYPGMEAGPRRFEAAMLAVLSI